MFRIKITSAVVLAVVVAGCATMSVDLPSITEAPTNARHAGKVVWHDLLTNKPAESRKFYSELFGWEFVKPGFDIGLGNESSYMLIRHNGNLIGGMVDTNSLGRSDNISQWVTVMSVDEIDTAAAEVLAGGGKMLSEPTDMKSRGILAILEDPSGAVVAMLQTKDGDPADREAGMNEFVWDELWTGDVDETAAFYARVFGLQYVDRQVEKNGGTYRLLNAGETPRAGIMENPFGDVPPVWVNYIRVADPAAITARVAGLGGQILVESQPRDIGGHVAFVAGPSGAGIALQTWPLD
ncbi:MAG: VOC family protein [Gammaproteobacteria bacterium]|nr:VOC family protein [Gammaproteobacteria bacterium]MDH4316263.1 VOC family protein [Gammaproteobacteria bacterium]MDH5215436.1 VOC family protein [Gammaproteobacteria bacterium]